ncbi:MAG: hypothetical protein IJU76_04920 [Desulfovibrionaceae bacterium]|nr:hypothetical protein [Desulfovibrionaceae bacterium]
MGVSLSTLRIWQEKGKLSPALTVCRLQELHTAKADDRERQKYLR